MRELSDIRSDGRAIGSLADLGLSLICGLFLTVLSPFETEHAPLGARLVYWVGMCLVWTLISIAIGLIAARSSYLESQKRLVRVAALLTIRTIPMTGIVYFATQKMLSVHFSALEIILLFGKVGLLCAGADYVAGRLAIHRSPLPTVPPPVLSGPADASPQQETSHNREKRASAPTCRLLRRLPLGQQGRLRCLSMEDHYVRVHTDLGTTLVLMRFADALEELDGTAGARVHRSWWIARSEPCVLRRDGRRVFLHLVDDLVIPVSTPYLAAAEAVTEAEAEAEAEAIAHRGMTASQLTS